MRNSLGIPVLVSSEGHNIMLERIALGAGTHNEAWLQALIHERPELLPVSRIEPAFGELVPIAREVPCGHGYIDNLYLTPVGDIVLVETKLWNNGEARREVVAQALDYVSALTSMGYDAFEAAIGKGSGLGARSLYAMVAERHDALPQSEFIDAVSANLARGRMLVIALGDGIRREARLLADLLQSHAGAHFTFALVELAIWRDAGSGDLVVVPHTLAQTVMIERGIVSIEHGRPIVKPAPARAREARTLSETMFHEEITKRDPSLPAALRAFLREVEPLGIYPELKASLNLKVDLADAARPLNLGYITKTGKLWTDSVIKVAPEEAALRYLRTLADLIGGKVATQASIYLSTDGGAAPFVDALLPRHRAGWVGAIRTLLSDMARHHERAPD